MKYWGRHVCVSEPIVYLGMGRLSRSISNAVEAEGTLRTDRIRSVGTGGVPEHTVYLGVGRKEGSPRTQVLGKVGGAFEHPTQFLQGGNIPMANVLVEGRIPKGSHHGRYFGNVPLAQIVIEGCGLEGRSESGNLGSIPRTNGLIELDRIEEGHVELGQRRSLPPTDVLIEIGRTLEGTLHRRHRLGIPISNLFVEVNRTLCQRIQTFQSTGIPIGNSSSPLHIAVLE